MSTVETNQKVNMPIDLQYKDGQFYIVILKTARRYYFDPFFLDSLKALYNISLKKETEEENNKLVKSLDYSTSNHAIETWTIEKFTDEYSTSVPQNKLLFVFHISRCGSTLISQILSDSKKFFVISEPPIINKILDPKSGLSKQIFSKLLIASMNCINSSAPEKSKDTVIKFRSWNTIYLKEITELFPTAPWIFVHRKGSEVLASTLQKPPGWLRSQKTYAEFYSKILTLETPYIIECGREEFVTRLLGYFCKLAYSNQSEKSYFLDYRNLIDNLFDTLKYAIDYEPNDKEKEKMNETIGIYSKDPNKKIKFTNDSELKNSSLSILQLNLTEQFTESERYKLLNRADYEN
ncbi:hypothetical protein [Parasediminibacterium sp. JCM 36343]|uniref:hypothetical protein n=1 Tax=Parasediminibacterium sp. JCM 36343 TaxID=3374279 RepID=UPI0039794ABC